MASSSFKNNNGSSLFKQDRRHFLSIIRGHAVHLHNLEIPRQFVRFHGDDLPRLMMLKVPNGATWPVEIVRRRNGQILFQKGWREFAKYYSLVEGSSLVFEFEKIGASCQFNVIIYDKSMYEIDYNVDDEEHSDSSVEILSSKPNFDGQAQGRQRVNQSCRRKKTFTTEEKAKAVYVHSEAEQRVNKSTFVRKKAEKAKAPVHCEGRKRSSITGRNKKLYKAEKTKAIERANSNFRSENPSFRMVLQPSYVDQKSMVSPVIPTKFAKKFLSKNNCDATLTLLDGRRSWPIKLYCPATSAKATTRIIVTGWRKFVKDNDLEVGDVCIFEGLLKYGNKTEFGVSVYKYSNLSRLPGKCKQSREKASCSKSKLSSDCRKRQRANLDELEMVDEAEDDVSVEILDHLSRSRKTKVKSPTSLPSRPNKKIKPESTSGKKRPTGQVEGSSKQPKEKGSSSKGLPKLSFSRRPEVKKLSSTMSPSFSNRTFQITMCQSYVHPCKHNLPIPVEFSRKYMKRENGDALFKVLGGSTWTVKYYANTRISGQTRTWVRNSSWKEFARENQLKVGDVCKFELIDLHKSLFKVVICRTRSANAGSKMPSVSNVERFGSENPIFKVAMSSNHLKGSRMNLPDNFINNLEHQRTRKPNLQLANRL